MLKNHKTDEQALLSGADLDTSSSSIPTSDGPWQSIGPLDIQFSLVFTHQQSNTALPVLLPCQCLQSKSSNQLPDCVAADFSFIRVCLLNCTPGEQSLLDDHAEVVLKLKHQQTWIEVVGHCSGYDSLNHLVTFVFDDPTSMQARMILQLVKICQMKADILKVLPNQAPADRFVAENQLDENDITYAAKTWSDKFAADFAKKFDKNN